jgi:Mg-chelatase subunit ChlD
MIITDALPTVGDDPKAESLSEISKLYAENITVSIIGIGLNEEGEEFGKEIVETGKGKFYRVNDLGSLNNIVLEDYYSYN